MASKKSLKDIDVATAQAILEHFGINELRTGTLAEILNCDNKRAGYILRRLSWTRDPTPRVNPMWRRKGMSKIWPTFQKTKIVKRAARMGVSI